MNAISSLSIVKWDEHTYQQLSNHMKQTRASVIFEAKGDCEGKFFVEYLMMYTDFDEKNPQLGAATYVGMMRFEGKLHGKPGSFVAYERGTFQAGIAQSVCEIIANSGTDALSKIVGTGNYKTGHGAFTFEMNYVLSP